MNMKVDYIRYLFARAFVLHAGNERDLANDAKSDRADVTQRSAVQTRLRHLGEDDLPRLFRFWEHGIDDLKDFTALGAVIVQLFFAAVFFFG